MQHLFRLMPLSHAIKTLADKVMSGKPLLATSADTASGQQVQVMLDIKPLPRARFTLYNVNGWQRALRADAAGRAEIALPWSGRYVLYVKHSLDAPDGFAGKSYVVKNLITTLSLVQP